MAGDFGDFLAGGVGGMGLGGTLGSAVPGIGTGIGMGVGFLTGGLANLFGSGGDDEVPQQAPVNLDPAAFAPIPTSDLDFSRELGQLGGIRQLGEQQGGRSFMTAMESEALGNLAGAASGQDLVSNLVAKQQSDQARQQIASQIATAQRGGYNPALQRLGVQQTAQAQQGIANQATVAAAQERLAAQQAFANAVRQQAQTNIGFGQLGVAGQAIDQQREAALLEMKRRYMAQGFSEAEANRQAQIQFQQGQTGIQLTENQQQHQTAMAERERQIRESGQRNQALLGLGTSALGFLSTRPEGKPGQKPTGRTGSVFGETPAQTKPPVDDFVVSQATDRF